MGPLWCHIEQGIHLAQARKEEGHLLDEVYLYEVLIKLYRLPEVLLRITTDGKDQSLQELPVLQP